LDQKKASFSTKRAAVTLIGHPHQARIRNLTVFGEHSCAGAFFVLTYLAFPGVSLCVLRFFACDWDFDGGQGFLMADYEVDCNTEKYMWYRLYACLMVAIYPVGIPLMYYCLCARKKILLMPRAEDVIDEVMNESNEEVDFNELMRHLAEASNELRAHANSVSLRARRALQKAKDEVVLKYERMSEEEKRESEIRDHSLVHRAMSLIGEGGEVPDDWQEHDPIAATIFAQYEADIAEVDMQLACAYRLRDNRIAELAFLFEAYEPRCWYFESVECMRRLMLTGLLVFVSPGRPLQIVCGAIISMIYMLLYAIVGPFVEESDDRLGAFAQLATFLQLFAGLILITGAMPSSISSVFLGPFMVVMNFSVMVFPFVSVLISMLPDVDEEFFDCCGGVWEMFLSIFGTDEGVDPEAQEDMEENVAVLGVVAAGAVGGIHAATTSRRVGMVDGRSDSAAGTVDLDAMMEMSFESEEQVRIEI
jgi:hypothetical protein